jgi:hypothetical protein
MACPPRSPCSRGSRAHFGEASSRPPRSLRRRRRRWTAALLSSSRPRARAAARDGRGPGQGPELRERATATATTHRAEERDQGKAAALRGEVGPHGARDVGGPHRRPDDHQIVVVGIAFAALDRRRTLQRALNGASQKTEETASTAGVDDLFEVGVHRPRDGARDVARGPRARVVDDESAHAEQESNQRAGPSKPSIAAHFERSAPPRGPAARGRCAWHAPAAAMKRAGRGAATSPSHPRALRLTDPRAALHPLRQQLRPLTRALLRTASPHPRALPSLDRGAELPSPRPTREGAPVRPLLVPQLGDGRAILLGELIAPAAASRHRSSRDSGRTAFSRGGDGRAALGPMLREYIVSEAMHALGVPTTRALAAVATGEPVLREQPAPRRRPGARRASHLRIGTFWYFRRARRSRGAARCSPTTPSRATTPRPRARPIRYSPPRRRDRHRPGELIARWMSLRLHPRRDEHRQHGPLRRDHRLRPLRLPRRVRSRTKVLQLHRRGTSGPLRLRPNQPRPSPRASRPPIAKPSERSSASPRRPAKTRR